MTIDPSVQDDIREAFQEGGLQVRAADPSTGKVGLYTVSAVLEHHTPHKEMVRITLDDGREAVTTVDHSLFHLKGEGICAVEAGEIRVGDQVATVTDDTVSSALVVGVETLPPEPTGKTYDLSVPGPENFLLTNGILAHNSYSIGGISLDVEKSSKYMDLKRNAEEQWDKLTEAKSRTVKYARGLQQPRFGRGVRSAFGPHTGRGILSPRKFV